MVQTKAVDPIDLHAGKQFRKRRQQIGFSQEYMGQSLSPPKTAQQIQKYESGHNRMGFSVLYQFSKILKVTPNYFAEGLPENDLKVIAGQTDAASLIEAKDTQNLIKYFTAIPNEEMRKNIVTFTKNTAKVFETNKGKR